MVRTLKDLLLAMLNATLILLALCLFLGWKLLSTLDGFKEDFAQRLELLQPLRTQTQDITGELKGLRNDLKELGENNGEISPAVAQRILGVLARTNAIEQRLEKTQSQLADLADAPEKLIDHAIDASAAAIANSINEIRSCTPAS